MAKAQMTKPQNVAAANVFSYCIGFDFGVRNTAGVGTEMLRLKEGRGSFGQESFGKDKVGHDTVGHDTVGIRTLGRSNVGKVIFGISILGIEN